jgi:hypothetical protein
MAENIGGADLFGSGGHIWIWTEGQAMDKQLGTAGTIGGGNLRTYIGPARWRIEGKRGPAILAASNSTRANADADLDILEEAILSRRRSGTIYGWEDDQGHTGAALIIDDYQRIGRRTYEHRGSTWTVWQRYQCAGRELTGGPFGGEVV